MFRIRRLCQSYNIYLFIKENNNNFNENRLNKEAFVNHVDPEKNITHINTLDDMNYSCYLGREREMR